MAEDNRYFGTYARFDLIEKSDAGFLIGADCLVGDEFTIDLEIEEGKHIAYLSNKFGKRLLYLDSKISRRLSVFAARGWKIRALLSFVAFTEKGGNSYYWGEMAIVANDSVYNEAFDAWAANIGKTMGEGRRPDVNLSVSGIQQVIDSNGAWIPATTSPYPTENHGAAVVKRKLSASEKMIEQGRKKNPGCYVISWAFIIACIVGVIFLIKSCGWF